MRLIVGQARTQTRVAGPRADTRPSGRLGASACRFPLWRAQRRGLKTPTYKGA